MKIAVTGAGEFVATRLIESFQLGTGPSLAAVARDPAELTTAARFALELRVADFLNIDSLARSFAGCSAVVHAARAASTEARRMASILCRAAAQAGVKRIVYVGSADVHGLCPAPGTTEKTALNPQAASDAEHALMVAERQFLSECKQLGLAGYALRAGFMFGPRGQATADLASALEMERAWVLQQGDGICNCLYVDNLVAAIRLALKAKSGAGAAYLLTDAETVTWREFYEAAARELRVSPSSIQAVDEVSPLALSAPDLLARQQCRWKLPTARAAADLGYEATVSFAEGIRRSIAWWRFAQGEFFAAA